MEPVEDSRGPLLSAAVAAFVQGGLSITVASRNDRLVPSIAKAVACRVTPDRCSVTVMLFAEVGEAVYRDIAHTGLIAVVASRPSTHETVQLKGSDAHSVPVGPAELALARRSLDLLAEDLRRLGWDAGYIDTAFWRDPADLVAIRFTPSGAFGQTPGANAGAALR
jgi:hypothetical protein